MVCFEARDVVLQKWEWGNRVLVLPVRAGRRQQRACIVYDERPRHIIF